MIKVYKISFLISTGILCLSFTLRMNHSSYTNFFLLLGTIFAFVYIFIALEDIYKSNRTLLEKTLWLLFFIFLSFITGVVYYYYLKGKTK